MDAADPGELRLKNKKKDFTGLMALMSSEGDVKYRWNKNDPVEVDIAKKTFDKYRKDGYLAFRMVNGEKGEMIREFDPEAGKILFVPPLCGG